MKETHIIDKGHLQYVKETYTIGTRDLQSDLANDATNIITRDVEKRPVSYVKETYIKRKRDLTNDVTNIVTNDVCPHTRRSSRIPHVLICILIYVIRPKTHTCIYVYLYM